jgi:hypothetical protein
VNTDVFESTKRLAGQNKIAQQNKAPVCFIYKSYLMHQINEILEIQIGFR